MRWPKYIDARALAQRGIPEPILLSLEETHETNRTSPSSTIFNPEGKILGAAIGVHDLALLKRICKDLGLSTETQYIGRGWQARNFQERINKHLNEKATVVPQAFET